MTLDAAKVSRAEMADHILATLSRHASQMQDAFVMPGRIATCYVDDLLPDALARDIHRAFPPSGRMMFKSSIKERKYVAAQMDAYAPILEEAVYAFQDLRVVELIGRITGLPALEPDKHLYAGGISAMPSGGYLKPHLDNSHDKTRARYRVLNLLYYVTPDWSEADGGALQLWDRGPKGPARKLEPLFNRLALMATNRSSWHSVEGIRGQRTRCCVSNYYFSRKPAEAAPYFHATSFRGAPGEHLADAAMRMDNAVRTLVLSTLGNRAYRNPHVYIRKAGDPMAGNPRDE